MDESLMIPFRRFKLPINVHEAHRLTADSPEMMTSELVYIDESECDPVDVLRFKDELSRSYTPR